MHIEEIQTEWSYVDEAAFMEARNNHIARLMMKMPKGVFKVDIKEMNSEKLEETLVHLGEEHTIPLHNFLELPVMEEGVRSLQEKSIMEGKIPCEIEVTSHGIIPVFAA